MTKNEKVALAKAQMEDILNLDLDLCKLYYVHIDDDKDVNDSLRDQVIIEMDGEVVNVVDARLMAELLITMQDDLAKESEAIYIVPDEEYDLAYTGLGETIIDVAKFDRNALDEYLVDVIPA